MGSLPFHQVAHVLAQSGEVRVSRIPISIWPARGFNSTSGRSYDHEAHVPYSYHAVFAEANLKVVEGEGSGSDELPDEHYAVVESVAYAMVPHVYLRLRRVRAGG